MRVLYILLHHLHNYLYIPVPNLHLNYICHIRFCILYFMLGFMLEDMTCTFFMYHIIYYIYIYIYIRSICRQQLFPSLRAHQYSSDQMKILKDQSAQTTARVVSVVYRLWLPFLINRMLNLTKLRSVIYDQSVDTSCFALWELISTAQIKWRSWRTRVFKLLLELWALHIVAISYCNIIIFILCLSTAIDDKNIFSNKRH